MITTVHPHAARRGRRFVAATAVTAAAALAFGLSSAPALADGATGKYVGNGPGGIAVETENHGKIQTNLFKLQLDDGATLQTYCIDAETAIRGGAEYREDAWDTYPGKGDFAQPGKVHTVLQSSFPTVGVADLAEAAGIEGLTEKEAVAGTQAAVWHFSNGTKLTEGGKHGANVDALYAHLVEQAEKSDTPEPEASLTITPEAAEGAAGETIGEFTVETSADSVPLKLDAPEGFQLVDVESGEPVEAAADGDTLGVKVPEGAEDGEASFSGTITATVEVGRLFRGVDGQPATQTLITADSSETEITAGAEVSWTSGGETPPDDGGDDGDEQPSPSPSPSTPDDGGNGGGDEGDGGQDEGDDKPAPGGGDEDQGGGLPVTGGALYGLIGAAVAAVGGGAAAIYFGRKRKASSEV
ncbi:thioester domain-containing protein [Nocardiopsis suaedae]|uniref:Thioester domain-containing protein n=1 Tax=Nocardiopsis suaedae TaxID=3018444 RepID=A0ABT4TI22_9ACTN|nr:thioester domain-containing protein [Nocardiopsis suaedae]MDA2804355.1 thioester domain-containing protein [Nocardiopsis suaedae]